MSIDYSDKRTLTLLQCRDFGIKADAIEKISVRHTQQLNNNKCTD